MNWVELVASAIPITVLIGVWELRQNNNVHRAEYEDSLEREYRMLAMIIPMDAFLGKEVTDAGPEVREALFNYLDLSNDQAHQYSRGRISSQTWKSWRSGIFANMKQPAFKGVWDEVQEVNPDTFTYLADLIKLGRVIDSSTGNNKRPLT